MLARSPLAFGGRLGERMFELLVILPLIIMIVVAGMLFVGFVFGE